MLNPHQARIRSFKVVPRLPEALKALEEIAHNLWWTWHPEAVELFVRLDRELWRETEHNPIKLLGRCPQARLEEAAQDEGFLSQLERVHATLQRHLTRQPWHEKAGHGEYEPETVAYFCAEFGLTESYQIYSGGLGLLAGDHLKSASELGLPLVAIGLLYRNGYFHQYLNADGWQQEHYPELDLPNLPVEPVFDEAGEMVKVTVDLPGRVVTVALWKTMVGRIPLYLLDTNLPENNETDRMITRNLYGGNQETRIQQEIVLGIGGVRALKAIGIRPDVCHMNEGHAAFIALERIKDLIIDHKINFDEARQFAAGSHVFTTHTPVPAGIDKFPKDLVERYFAGYVHHIGLDMEGMLALGREDVFDRDSAFSMAVLAIRTSDFANGVSKLHGVVSRDMWQGIWPQVPTEEVPIGHVTNGVHARSWISGDLSQMLDRYLGSRWQADPVNHKVWEAVHEVPSEELWRVHSRRRQRLIAWVRWYLREQLEKQGISDASIRETLDQLSPDAFTIGFARRFATYKRGTLLMRDRERLMRLLTDADRPVQVLIAGKAHPADNGGKELIQRIVQFSRQSNAGHRIVFLEDYDISIARRLVQGCDIWLNTPRRGMEASGTSGMKAAINGVPNVSIMDGWWDEAAEPGVGWPIGRGEDYDHDHLADERESKALYDLLEHEVLPLFYDRDTQNVPRGWVEVMKTCIAKLAPKFNTNRMLQDYAEKYYFPAYHRQAKLGAENLKPAIESAKQVGRLREAWGKVQVSDVQIDGPTPLGVDDTLKVEAVVDLGGLSPSDVKVQVYAGTLNNDGALIDGHPADLTVGETLADGRMKYHGSLSAGTSGNYGFAIRVVPGGDALDGIIVPGLIKWENTPAAPTPPKPKKPRVTKPAADTAKASAS